MLNVTESEALALNALQRGLPLTEHPFEEIATDCGMTVEQVLALIRRLRDADDYRRLGAIFDARRLRYRSVLCSAKFPEADLARAAEIVSALPGVTHCYERGWPKELSITSPGGPGDNHWPNLWFTLAAPEERFDVEFVALEQGVSPVEIHPFPATRRFKIDVMFHLSTRDRDEQVESSPCIRRTGMPEKDEDAYTVTPKDLAIIRAMQGDLPPLDRFYMSAARAVGCTETELLQRLRLWHASGVLRRVGLILRHRKVGFTANGMCCWNPPEEDTIAAGRRLAEFPEVTHCYERPWSPIFPFRLYAMIHTTSFTDTQNLFERLTSAIGLQDGQLLFSLREFKKTSLTF